MGILRSKARTILQQFLNQKMHISWVQKEPDSFLSQLLTDKSYKPPRSSHSKQIERIAEQTNNLGPQPLWKGYIGNNIAGSTRLPNDVRTACAMGNFYTELTRCLEPKTIVEFGTAFGVSSMYFLAGIESTKHGHLYTFEPNEVWRDQALSNMNKISSCFTSVHGTFEDNVDQTLSNDTLIDLAFVDAIHTREFVEPQTEIVIKRSHSGTIIILDDINFSDNMRECWDYFANDARFKASASLGERVGLLELA